MNMRASSGRWIATFTTVVSVLGICPLRSAAQVIRGELQASKQGQGAGVSGAVVQLLDSAGNALAPRTLSNEHGVFTLRVPGPGRYFLRARRIGFHPVTSTLLAIARDTSVSLAMVDIPISLPPLTAVERNECHIRPDSGLAIASLWEEAKTALISAEITREANSYTFDLVDHSRTFEFSSGDLLSVALNETSAYDTRSWASVPPEDLRRDGYARFGSDSTAFIAPDIETLLSNYFADTHCLRIGAHPFAPDSLVAIDFDPATDVEHIEIRGTLWLNRVSHNLTAIDYHYVNLDLGVSVADTAAGGRVEFAPLASGGWVLTDWSIRMPMVHIAVDRQLHPTGNREYRRRMRLPPTPSQLRKRVVPDQLRVAGGTLRAVFRDSTPVWSQPRQRMAVHVTSGPARRPASRDEAFASLVGTNLWVHTDSTGLATFDGLMHGSYLVDVSTKELDVLGWPRERVRVDIGGKPGEITEVQLQSALAAARAACIDNERSLNDSTGVIIGSVKAGDRPIADRLVTLSWPEKPFGGKRVSRTARTLSGDGRYIVCGVPRDRTVTVHVDGDDDAHDKTARIEHEHVVAIVDVPIDR